MQQIAVLISNAGTGTNLQALIDGVESRKIEGQIAVVISDTTDAYGLERAKKHHLPTHILKKSESLTEVLQKYEIDIVALAGWKQIITKDTIDRYKNKILNLHPGLIPDTSGGEVLNPDGTKGLWNRNKFTDNAIQNYFDRYATYAGSSIHFLTHELDFGPVLARRFEKIKPEDTVKSLYARLKVKENEMYVEVLGKLSNKSTESMKKKTVLIIGSGGREHTIGWKLRQSSDVDEIYFAPGNGGTSSIGENVAIKAEDIVGLLRFAKEKKTDLTIVGPEVPLALGIVDTFQKNNLRIFGPTKNASQLESSKSWAVRFMQESKIPHPVSEIFTDFTPAFEYVKQIKGDCVIKADGLAAGKGVYICSNIEAGERALKEIMIQKVFGEAGETVVIQEKLIGQEVSVMAFCDGKNAIPIITAQDHKRIFDGDRGLNTGGMGAFAPSDLPVRVLQKMQRLLTLVVERMAEKGMSYVGVLYGGFMLVENEPYVLEFNCRMGDPETQVQLPLLTSDLLTIIEACIDGTLTPKLVQFSDKSALCVILASEGYPGAYIKGREIQGLDVEVKKNELIFFHAGTKLQGKKVITDGGRVLAVTTVCDSLEKGRRKVYDAIGNKIHFENMQYRRDIGVKR